MKRGAVVIVFARNPVPGQVKTRLVPRLGAWGAARLQRRLALHAIGVAQASGCTVEVHAASQPAAPFFRLCRRLGARVREQRGGDLGARMHGAMRAALRRHRAAVLIGSDCPELQARDLRRALRLLQGGNAVVLAPALDGGYALVAARRVAPALFEGVPWGGSEVLSTTVRRLEALGYRWRALRIVADIDRPEDLARLHTPNRPIR